MILNDRGLPLLTEGAGTSPAPVPLPIDGYRCSRCLGLLEADVDGPCRWCGAELETSYARVREERWATADPAWQEVLDRFFGPNPYGEPRFRIVWAPTRMEIAFGEWTDYDEATGSLIRRRDERRRIPKYPDIGERWIIEMWCRPEKYGTPEAWYATDPVLGPYPYRGDYEQVFIFEIPKTGEFALPTRERLEFWSRMTVETLSRTIRERLAAKKALKERAEQAKDMKASDRYDDQCIPAFYGAPQVSFAGPKSKGRRA